VKVVVQLVRVRLLKSSNKLKDLIQKLNILSAPVTERFFFAAEIQNYSDLAQV
jgi:hypothetical protein